MEADFTGWATKANLKCSDGRTIATDAFKHQDTMQVPLVWQHGHNNPENVLGHVLLQNQAEGVRVSGFFNDTAKAQHSKSSVMHKDIRYLSIWANDLIERQKTVLHGTIREVSLVLSGANPGALIDTITIHHSDGDYQLEDEYIIYTGEEINLAHSDLPDDDSDESDDSEDEEATETEEEVAVSHADDSDDGPTIAEVYESMNDDQKEVLHFMVAEALSSGKSASDDNDKSAKHDDLGVIADEEGNKEMGHNVFDRTDESETQTQNVLSHDAMKGIFESAKKKGSLKDAIEDYATEHLEHGINDIETLFPDAQSLDAAPEWVKRQTEWVDEFLLSTRKSPFSRLRTRSADLTFEDARAKGYVKASLKKEEFFGVQARTTTPTTVYKKQAIDRDDLVDITDFDVVAWLKAEMRVMLNEEVARAALFGDGRDVSDEDKINEQNIRPIASDHELYTTTVNLNLEDASSSIDEFIDAVVSSRRYYRGSGLPNLYTTETYITQTLMKKDTLGRRIYKSLDEVASELRVNKIVPVEAMEGEDDIVAIMVNPSDYVFGATRGGEVNMFDDFDIDYNKHKYLIETRVSGSLVKVKSAVCFRKVAGTDVLVSPAAPEFDPVAGEVTIVNTTGVVYKDADGTVINAAGSPYDVDSGDSYTVNATPASGYYFGSSEDDTWTFTAD